ncbi:protein phosphatase 1 regulatory subunit 37 [Tetranychus urticae]|uniref:protein phosphatase 1 regulatory subunit 37 n=1 Tax=Tetranychus urticae TaxID=32264 RepID=UPI00077B9048|nr:protein phosphatase 1 regulatory subunit 37 [Tetranychus urticae]XP_015787915.1 protein phosphatase 1 regulatory subunit 37 [Tetranychus urticae]
MEVVQRSNSAPSTPTGPSSGDEKRSQSSIDGFSVKGRKVQFPSDEEIVTKYFDAPDPWSYLAPHQLTSQSLIEAYQNACDNQGTKPLPRVLSQLQKLHGFTDREEDLNLKGEKLDAKGCEALEEIFKRIRFRSINLESCNLDEEGASSLFDMIEYYESATHLNLANNKAIGMRGWQACCRMLKKTPCLQHLDLRNCSLSEQVLLILGRALRIGSHLVSLRLERSGISSRALAILVAALKLNTSLQYLYLGDNKLCSGDAIQIGNLLRANSTLEFLDLRDNHLQDEGLEHIAEALRSQPGPGDGLKYLIISNNQMTSRGMNSLVEALRYTKSLCTVNLNDNSLGDEGIIKLKEGIIMAPKISALGLKNCKLNCQGAIAIADCFMEGDNLRRVDLRENDIAERGLLALCLAVQTNRQVFRVDISNNIISTKDPTDPSSTNCSQLIAQINLACESNQKAHAKGEDIIFIDQGLESPGAKIDLFPYGTFNELNQSEVEYRNSYYQEISDSLQEITHNQSKVSQAHPRKPILRSSSLGSWDSKATQVSLPKVNENNNKEPVRRSGRFSVSPVPDSDSPPPPIASSSSANLTPSPLLYSPYPSPEPLQSSTSSFHHNRETPSPTISPLPSDNVTSPYNYSKPFYADPNNNTEDNFSEVATCTTAAVNPKPKKRISFALPDDTCGFPGSSSEAFTKLRNRRMSSPAVPNNSTAVHKPTRPKIPSLKMYKILDGLDLKSSVPLSPTRLYQSLEFPDLISWKLPSEKEKPVMIGITN